MYILDTQKKELHGETNGQLFRHMRDDLCTYCTMVLFPFLSESQLFGAILRHHLSEMAQEAIRRHSRTMRKECFHAYHEMS